MLAARLARRHWPGTPRRRPSTSIRFFWAARPIRWRSAWSSNSAPASARPAVGGSPTR